MGYTEEQDLKRRIAALEAERDGMKARLAHGRESWDAMAPWLVMPRHAECFDHHASQLESALGCGGPFTCPSCAALEAKLERVREWLEAHAYPRSSIAGPEITTGEKDTQELCDILDDEKANSCQGHSLDGHNGGEVGE